MEQLVLSIKFTASEQNKAEFKQTLIDLFNTISHETNFVNAILHEGMGKPQEFLVYETWNDTIDHFLTVQMKQPYALAFEQKLVDLGIKREPAAYTSFAKFGTALKA